MGTVLEVAAAITLILGCLTGIGMGLNRLWKGLRRLVHIADRFDKQADLVEYQLSPNGGGSMVDLARKGAEESKTARELAAQVAVELADFRQHQARDSEEGRQARSRLQHDMSNMRAGQELLLSEQAIIKGHAQDDREQVALLAGEVRAIRQETTLRDQALGGALVEQLDVALVSGDGQEQQ